MIRMGPILYARLVGMLVDGPVTLQDIQDELGLHEFTVRDYVKALHKHKLCHIAIWSLAGPKQRRVAHYTWGRGADARRPPPLPDKLRQLHYRQRQAARTLKRAMSNFTKGAIK